MTKPFSTTRRVLILALAVSAWVGSTGCEAPPVAGPSNGVSNTVTPAPASTSTPALRTTVDCSGSLPGDIIDAIYDELEKSTTITREEWQFNIAVADSGSRRTIRITGWSKNRDHIFNTVKRIAPNCEWNDDNFKTERDQLDPNYRFPVSCNQGYKPCGDICIPDNEDCKIVGASVPPAPVVPPKANSAPRSNVNSSPNSNSRTAPSNANSR